MKQRSKLFLFNTTREQLNFKILPGNLLKKETREIAKNLDLNVADKPDSQDICVPNGDYVSVIENSDSDFLKGNIKNTSGKVLECTKE